MPWCQVENNGVMIVEILNIPENLYFCSITPFLKCPLCTCSYILLSSVCFATFWGLLNKTLQAQTIFAGEWDSPGH